MSLVMGAPYTIFEEYEGDKQSKEKSTIWPSIDHIDL
jgi:hypothetical protein